MTHSAIKTALLSVSDKTGIVEFATSLHENHIQIFSTGGTAKLLKQQNIPVTDVSNYTGFPEIMGGRVKTLHPKIYGGILRRPNIDDSLLDEHSINPIDLVVVNLYPFQETIAKHPNPKDKEHQQLAVENIDIGGPSMLRAAAKNHQAVTVISDPQDYQATIDEIKQHNTISLETRLKLAQKAFEHTANYDSAIANYFAKMNQFDEEEKSFPLVLQAKFNQQALLRYGENPHQQAAFYVTTPTEPGTIAHSQLLQGKALSYNNLADADTALECVKELDPAIPGCVIVKHANPCGVASRTTLEEAYRSAYAADSISAFGGIIAFNQPVDATTADAILSQQFVEMIIAPAFNDDTIAIFANKPNVRILACGAWPNEPNPAWEFKSINGGLLIQNRDISEVNIKNLRIVSQRVPTDEEMNHLIFAWKVAKYVKSNAIVFAKDNQTIGIGAGQMNRLDSVRIATQKAHEFKFKCANAVMASDAFFPFADGIDTAIDAGITAVIQPGGAMRDEEVITAANKADLAMVFTGMRHFRH